MFQVSSSQSRERERESKPFSRPFSFQYLLKAYYSCRRRKRNTVNAGKFELNFENELLRLERELKSKTYRPGRSICFVITEPKPREVFAADFRDRIVHHLIVGFLEPFWEKKFIHHSYSCRLKKGAHLAIKDLKRYMRKASCSFSRPAYYLQVDIAGFFMSIDKKILFSILAKHLHNENWLWLGEKIIFHNPVKDFYYKGDPNLYNLIPPRKSLFNVSPNKGLPIGNLTSQFFANVYLNELDQFVKHKLKIKYYLRYVDDILIIHENPEQLKKWRKQISHFLNEYLNLQLHPKKTVLQSIYKGINFVGFVVKPHHLLTRRKIVGNLKKKLWYFNNTPIPDTYENFNLLLGNILAVINSYYGQFKHANTFNLRRSLYKKNFGVLKTYLEPIDENFSYFRIKG
ncbi:MAG: reverse transcriptase/maturase family protein [Patescibacteria group bacterium]|nr:reverse transcriptase/maturase family protein [Patescibacteria group bacterium]